MGEMGVLMIAGGGTGGHIYPAIAIAQEFLARDPHRRVVFVGTEYGLEKTIVPKAGFPLEFIAARALKGKGAVARLGSLARLPVAVVQSWRLIRKYRPGVVLGVGGYSSGPVLLAARFRGVPTAIHEQNAFPGMANRQLARFVTAVALGFADAAPRLGRSDAVVTGNPIRREMFAVQRHPSGGGRQGLLVFGGSQGSHVLNEAMSGALLFLARLKDRLDIVHQTGPKELETVRAAYRNSAFPGARIVPYLDPISEAIGEADLVVCRAGASSIGDVAAIGRAAVLVPFAAAADNHQEVNARAVEKAGGAVVIAERELSPERLALTISELLNDPQRVQRMGAAARILAVPDASNKIVDLLEKIEQTE